MPTLFITVGVPGSGKSHFAERLCKEYGFVHLRSDTIRDILFSNPTYSPTENKGLFALMDFLANEFLSKGVSVVYDANFTKRDYRIKMAKVAKKNHAKYVVLWIKTPFSTALKRAKSRKYHKVGKEVVLGIHKETEYPHNEPVISIDGTKPYRNQKKLLERYF
jgi:predicted kinase